MRALRDATLDRRLERDGFVTMPLLDDDAVADLRETFGSLRGWQGSGFQTDLQHPDPDYKRAVNAAVLERIGGLVSEQFVDHVPFLCNFLCKHPGEGSELYLHRDWAYVDERTGARTFVVWIALQDVADNGPLRVLRGSHHIDRAPRGTDLIAPWLEHGDVIGERLRSVRVASGHAVVMDNALTHGSYPNLSDAPRLVVAVGMRPRSAPLTYFHRLDERTAARYDIDEDFFCTHTPQGLLQQAPDLPIAETLPAGQLALDAAALRDRLDAAPLVRVDRALRVAAGLPARGLQAADDVARRAVPLGRTGRRSRGSGRIRRVLVLTSAPDDRASTSRLRAIVAALERRDDVDRAELWYLTDPEGRAAPGEVVLDAPVTAPVVGPLSRIRSLPIGRRARMVRRYADLVRLRPDAVVFDDGLGAPLLSRLTRPHVRVRRTNTEPPVHVPADLRADVGDADLAIVSPGAARPVDLDVLDERVVAAGDAAPRDPVRERADARAALDLPDGARLVVGIGSHGWVDGPDLFVRTLWALRERHGVVVHGRWILRHATVDERGPLEAEIERCGLAEQVRLADEDHDVDLRLGADVALLPCREAGDEWDVADLLDRSIPIVSFPVWGIEHPDLHVVDHLDVEAAATRLADVLAIDRPVRTEPVEQRDPLEEWTGELLDRLRDLRR